jgi:tetratricopeptide (TPR) repeat protein
MALVHVCTGMTVEEYLGQVDERMGVEDYDGAITMVEDALKEYPESSALYTKLGVLYGIKVQMINDYANVFQAINTVFDQWDKALDLEPANIEARFQRGVWGVNVPKFLGRIEQGVLDLDTIITILHQIEDPSVYEQLIMAYYYLAYGLQRLMALNEATELYNSVIENAPDSDLAQAAQENLEMIREYETWQALQDAKKLPDNENITRLLSKLDTEPDNIEMLLALAREYRAIARYEDAVMALQHAQEVDWANPEVYRLLALVLGDISEQGYNPRIALDTDFRTDLAFETVRALDMAVQLAPDDMGLRFMRGIADIEMPFFTGTLEQGIADLEMVMENSEDPSVQAEVLYYLGRAYQKKAVTCWGQAVTAFSDERIADAVFKDFMPEITRFNPSQQKRPYVTIDFVLGFQDELPPQTAVWITDENGYFVKTVYVSGFSGNAKAQQVNLPMWASTSEFVDADMVSGASIDLGHHVYVWDMKDHAGKRVKKGAYTANVEVTFWPSMQYQRVEVPFQVGKKGEPVVVEEGNYIPFVEVIYIK